MGIDIVIFTDEVGHCIVPEKGHRNQDGYIRRLDKPRSQGGTVANVTPNGLENTNGKIPDGYEINHKCKVRDCINIDHLECIPRAIHRSQDNRQRYTKRAQEIYNYKINNPNVYQRDIGKLFNVTQACVSRIIQRLSKEKNRVL